MSDTIYSFTLSVKVHIRHRPDAEFPYDWYTDGGEESSYRFATQEEAVTDAETFYQ